MATIYDVAKRARVSTYTVSSVLNRTAYVSPELTTRVQEAVRALDYTINEIARGLQTRKTKTVGMLIPDIANPFYAKVVRGVENVLKEANYSLILGSTYNQKEEQSRYLAVFRAKQVDGLKRALKNRGLAAPKELLAHGDWTADAGYSATVRFLDLPEPPTAIFAVNFLMMTGMLRALHERGVRCPQEVEVISSDDSEWLDVFAPRISTVAQPSYEMGEKSAQLLLKRMRAPRRRFEQIVLEPELVIR